MELEIRASDGTYEISPSSCIASGIGFRDRLALSRLQLHTRGACMKGVEARVYRTALYILSMPMKLNI